MIKYIYLFSVFQRYSFSAWVKNQQLLLLYSLLNKRLRSNLYSKYTFFVIFSNFPSKWKSKWSAKVLHSLGAAKVLQITLTFVLTKNFVNLTIFFVKPRENAAKLMIFHQHNYNSELISYLVNSIAIQLRDRRLGGIWFLQTLGSHFIPRELRSLGMKWLPRVCKNHSLPLGDHAIL